MPLYTIEQLEELAEFDDLQKALRNPEDVIRLRVYEHQDPEALERVAELRNLQSLYISLANVSRLLPRLGELKDLQKIALQACNVPAFPGSIYGLKHLRDLSIGNSGLGELPEELGSMPQLEELWFTQNCIQRLPESIGKLTRLRLLGLHYNQIAGLPDSLGELQELEWLSLGMNRLAHLPPAIGRLTRLKRLSLECNQLRLLPDAICDLRELEHLSLEGNAFDSLPRCIASIKDLSIEAEKRSLVMDWSYPHSQKPPRAELADLRLYVTPASDLYEPVVAAIDESGLSEIAPVLIPLAREAVRIESTVPDDYSQPGNSRLGGFPDLPDPALFPRDERGRYWIFLAQFNLAELAPFNGHLPRRGLLSFFLDSTEDRNARVLFHEGEPRKLATVRHGGGDEVTDPTDDYTANPHRVKFTRYFSLPYHAPKAIGDDDTADTYSGCESLHPSVDHHINGYTFTQLDSPQQQAADALKGQAGEWVPLLQLGWDKKVGFCFWDAGTLTFCIHQEDLRRGDFSHVHVSLETS